MRSISSRELAGLSLLVGFIASACGSQGDPTAGLRQCLGAIPTELREDCAELRPGESLPQPLTSCFVVKQAGTYVHEYINVLDGGSLFFAEPVNGGTIDFQAKSILVEKGGLFQAGAPDCVFGVHGGKLSIGLYGDDPSERATIEDPPAGIRCMTNPASEQRCFPADRDPSEQDLYCVGPDPEDPCASTDPPDDDGDNALLEAYGNLNFDPTPWGYKTFGVAYGGRLRLFGAKGALPLQDEDWAAQYDSDAHCVVPGEEQSGLDAEEMRAWAALTGSSWVRLEDAEDSDAGTLLTLDRRVSRWDVGDRIVVGTTDWYPGHSEEREILAVTEVEQGGTTRTQLLVARLDYEHVSDIFDTEQIEGATFTNPVNRKAVDLRAVVALLSRSIEIRSLGAEPQRSPEEPGFPETADCMYDGEVDPDPACYFGAHLIARQGVGQFQLQGVELRQMGQGARIGHYPVHFHHVKSADYAEGDIFLKDSAVWDSMNRFVTVHGTIGVTLARNVGYLSMGHGYYLEDGSEIENRLCHNVGIGARASMNEFFVAQQQKALDDGGTPLRTARFVPPILDGGIRFTDPDRPFYRTGSDGSMPVMYWTMNAYNELVGNHAVGVYGFGSCYWLLGSGLSGSSRTHHKFAGYAAYNAFPSPPNGFPSDRHAPVLRFRGNSCTTATYALPSSIAVTPGGKNNPIGYTEASNPYITNADGSKKSDAELGMNYARPYLTGNYVAIPKNDRSQQCANAGTNEAGLEANVESCAMTLIDRFTTSFNSAQVNFGSIWLRPYMYLFANGAVTDQLGGGLTFVTGGSWLQVAPAYLSLAQNSLFVGTTQHGGSKYAQRSGPIFEHSSSEPFTACSAVAQTTCDLPVEGTGYFRGEFNPKRLINIYDGPAYADGNTFLNVGSWQCDPQPAAGQDFDGPLPCGVYSSTTQPLAPDGSNEMLVLDAAIGWKQPNGFYYPPAFAYRGNAFYADLPEEVDPDHPLHQCYSYDPDTDQFEMRPGDCRHNAFDRTQDYIAGDLINTKAPPTITTAESNQLPTTPIDFSTILLDLDGSLTGASSRLGELERLPTTSVSRNTFYDAPSQSGECLSYGVQTSPFQFVTTAMAVLEDSPANADPTYIDTAWPETPAVAIYRQWKLQSDEAEPCGQVCDADDGTRYGCKRATYMMGSSIFQANYLTMAIPPDLEGQQGALYYIDTSSEQMQSLSCVKARTQVTQLASFDAGNSYLLYNLFARDDAKISYQLYVGEGAELASVQPRYVRVTPRIFGGTNPSATKSTVRDACVPGEPGTWCADMPVPTLQDGVLTVTLDQRFIADDYRISTRPDYERCMPRDVCYYDESVERCEPCIDDPSKCIRQGDFLDEDRRVMNRTDATGRQPLETLCQDWASYASGTHDRGREGLSLIDCPTGGCLGLAFTMPPGFVGNKSYAEIGAPLATCFDEALWTQNQLIARTGVGGDLRDPRCGPPRESQGSDYCSDN